jgi:CheY-like chemotaxis protein
LEPIGFAVVAAPDGDAALSLAGECTPDLFILDISMPGMSGWEVARRLRNLGHDAPVLMMSANIGDRDDRIDGPPDHDDALSKPVDMRTLIERVSTMLALCVIRADGEATPSTFPMTAQYSAPPGSRHIEELQRLGEIGFVSAIEAKLAELEAADLGSGPFVTAARARIRAFDLRGYMILLGKVLAREHADE